MSLLELNLPEHEWIKKFDPHKRILSGRAYTLAKRVMDITLVVLTMPFWSLLMFLLIPAVWITSGRPVFFIQFRTGKGGKRFPMYKFRTMVKNAEDLKEGLAETDGNGHLAGPLKLHNDPRVTAIGRLLRKTSLDELPQVINVLLGQMSLVGPRPTSWTPESYKLWHTERLDVVPGMTGLWQLSGRGSEDFDEWLRWDCRYIERRSVWFDLMILVRTILKFLRQTGAH